jgi:23S rRNA pseudouridine1911/1915/1917 synthase
VSQSKTGAMEERETMQILVPEGEHPKRLDVYLTHHVENATRNKVQQGIESGDVLVNGKVVKVSYRLRPNDVIDITFQRPPHHEALPEAIPLDVVYEDASLLIINKTAGMVVHPAYGHSTGTLVNALLHYCNKLSQINTELRPGIVHRLDKDTTGLMVVAKNDVAHHKLALQFSKRTLDREYWALAWGKFKSPRGTIDTNLGRSKKDRKKVAVNKEGKHAVTEYEVLQELDYLTLVRLHLKTGRTHQIRVHLAHIGHPVFGDPTYGGRSETWGGLSGAKARQAAHCLEILQRQGLHAKTIGFVHPVTNERMKFDSILPDDMQQVIDRLTSTGAVSKK